MEKLLKKNLKEICILSTGDHGEAGLPGLSGDKGESGEPGNPGKPHPYFLFMVQFETILIKTKKKVLCFL